MLYLLAVGCKPGQMLVEPKLSQKLVTVPHANMTLDLARIVRPALPQSERVIPFTFSSSESSSLPCSAVDSSSGVGIHSRWPGYCRIPRFRIECNFPFTLPPLIGRLLPRTLPQDRRSRLLLQKEHPVDRTISSQSPRRRFASARRLSRPIPGTLVQNLIVLVRVSRAHGAFAPASSLQVEESKASRETSRHRRLISSPTSIPSRID